MCNIYHNTTSRKRTGYKILAMKDGKFYSTFTGQEIGIGVVAKAPSNAIRLSKYWNDLMDTTPIEALGFYNPALNGYSSAFIDEDDAKYLYSRMLATTLTRNYKLVIVKIMFKVAIIGSYTSRALICGNEITKIIDVTDKLIDHEETM